MKGFIEVYCYGKWIEPRKIEVHYTQIWFDGVRPKFRNDYLAETYEEIKELIKKAE